MPLNASKPEDPEIITVETWLGGFLHVSGVYGSMKAAECYARWVDQCAPEDQPRSRAVKMPEQEFIARLTAELPKFTEAAERRKAEHGRV